MLIDFIEKPKLLFEQEQQKQQSNIDKKIVLFLKEIE